ncbi:hypothetical protein [Empedobacter brevis]|uniref:hypothetical protein n=1 Tax=Empedobacter brevis TaxID=247 RepID=UPI0028D39740|nr:hypothetical protein [Empedobacter brevis]
MIKVYNSDFELDLSPYAVQFIDRNNWFEESQMDSFTVPLRIPIDEYFEVYRYYTENEYEALHDVYLNRYGKIFVAVLEITDTDDEFLEIEIRYGLDQFPNWEKPLSELVFPKITVADIRQHALEIMTKNYPETNYQFPKVWTELYPKDNAVWQSFKGFYNNLEDGIFIENSIDIENNIVYNNNIMRPMPYLLHVLKVGIEDAGYTLKGDILTNETLLKTLVIPTTKVELKDRPETVEWNIGNECYTREGFRNRLGKGWQYGRWEDEITLPAFGKYRLKGTIHNSGKKHHDIAANIKLDGTVIFSNTGRNSYPVDVVFTSKKTGSKLSIYARDYARNGEKTELKITPLELYEENGQEIIYSVDSNEINIADHVNEMTFGDFVTKVMSIHNYDFTPGDKNTIWMNLKHEDIVPDRGLDLSQYDVKSPGRTFNSGKSFLLKYPELDEPYTIKSLFVDKSGTKTENYTTNDRTTEIDLKFVPLPVENINGVFTSKIIVSDTNQLCLAIYDADGESNTTESVQSLMMENIYAVYYYLWLYFLLSATVYKWSFDCYWSDMFELNIRKKVFAYENYHIIKELSRKRVSEELENIEIETYSIRR